MQLLSNKAQQYQLHDLVLLSHGGNSSEVGTEKVSEK